MSSISTRKFAVGLAEFQSEAFRAARRVIINAEILKTSKICAGDVVALLDADNVRENEKAFAVGVAWPSLEISQESVLVSSSLLLTARIAEGTKAHVFPLSGIASIKLPSSIPTLRQAQEAGTIRLKEISSTGSTTLGTKFLNGKGKGRDWLPLLLRENIVGLKYITSAQILEVQYEGQTRRFSIVSISLHGPGADLTSELNALSIDSSPQLWTAGWGTSVIISKNEVDQNADTLERHTVTALPRSPQENPYGAVGGLEKQILQIRDLLEIPLTRPELFRHFGLKPPRGLLLHGPPGTGKTHLARAIASSTNSAVLVINGPELSSAYHGETEAKLRDVFKEAREKSPCIVVLDEIDALVPRREDGAGGEVEKRVVATLLTILDGMEDENSDNKGRVVVIGTTNRPNAIDPALRRPGRFDREIEIGIPDIQARFAILQVLLAKVPHSILAEELHAIAARAHGYVGADLSAVIREAGTIAIKRWLASSPADQSSTKPIMVIADLVSSLPSVRPSGMRSLFFETTPIHYSDIGGQKETIEKLRETVEWPLLHPEAFDRLGVKPPKGILLYGPPGCSKTVLVRACACESGVNFVAVKGPELLNKFVGESERAVREIFRKARAAAPSIIFFDEIDALATSRSSEDSGAGSHEGVLTSLLNEMDGVQELTGVTVVAATNRPDVIDSALMRPGRLDRILYVGPPDQQGREEILKIRLRKMSTGSDVDVAEIAQLTEGCSGAEITALCQEAALYVMKKDINVPHVPHEAFVSVAKSMKRQITPHMIQKFERWKNDAMQI